MQVKAIKNLLSKFSLDELRSKESQLLNGEELDFAEVEGVDEGEQLTHLTGAIWCIEEASSKNGNPQDEVRNFAARVRNSIS